MWQELEKEEFCKGCSSVLIEPYIKCVQCLEESTLLCLHCFAHGLEIGQHENDHDYEVIKDDFTVLEKTWKAREERALLSAISECGIGNWTDVANQLKSKTAKQCQLHYNKFYLNDCHHDFPVLKDRDVKCHPTPFFFRPCEDPPRPADGSSLQQDMSGYMAARGDFTLEHRQHAELDLNHLHFNHTDVGLDKELKLAVLDVYRNILGEREKRKETIKKYGLINMRKQVLVERRYHGSIGYERMERLRSVMRLVEPEAWDLYLESVHYEAQLKTRIRQLQEYRRQGIINAVSANVYERLKSSREEYWSRKPLFDDVCNNIKDDTICQQWLNKQTRLGVVATLPNATRRVAPPLDVSGLPGCDKLSEDEKQLCSSSRIVPESYLQYKSTLIHEQNKSGHVKLRVARTLIKIDVNKTRKVYDFLCKEGYISKNT